MFSSFISDLKTRFSRVSSFFCLLDNSNLVTVCYQTVIEFLEFS